jgi:UDP-GlcNAc:undecaprenyl-phosphate GlcNAc-1-phosphate transferase
MSSPSYLYLLCFAAAFLLSLGMTPIMRRVAIAFNILDHPHSDLKTHEQPVPYLGGVAVAVALVLTLTAIRLFTRFPSGTLHSLRGIFLGGSVILLLGLVDDIKPKGLGYRFKFLCRSRRRCA